MTKRPVLVGVIAILVALVAVFALERERAGLSVVSTFVAGTPVTLVSEGPGPLVVVAHGFAGSRQMMRPITTVLARSGMVVASVDLLGHGRNTAPMTGDVTRLDGATARLVDQVVAVTEALREPGQPVSLLGHSMATDVVVRAASRLEGVDAVVAISMYSEAVTATAPNRLLVISGAQEGRLRENALAAVRMVDARAVEGDVVVAGSAERGAMVAPIVGHVGVLYSGFTLNAVREWVAPGPSGSVPMTGVLVGALLVALIALAWPMATVLGPVTVAPRCERGVAWRAVALPILPAVLATWAMPEGLLGLAAFGQLAVFLAIWGLVQGAVMWVGGRRLPEARPLAAIMLTGWGLGLFALALDRYGAAFLPVGERLAVAALMLPGALVFALSDAALTQGARWPLRIAARAVPMAALLGAMMLSPMMGVAFTVIPVTILFWLVYGLAARWVAARAGHGTTGIALGVILAWAIAASTPMIAV